MGLLDRFRKIKPSPPTVAAGTKFFMGNGMLELSDNRLVTEKSVSNKTLEAYVGWVYSNVKRLAEEVSKIEFELFTIKITKDSVDYVPIDSHPLLDLLDRFNSHTTTSDAMFMTEAHLDLAGDTFFLLDGEGADVKVGTNIKNIYILPPDKVQLLFDDQGIVSGYKYSTNIDGKKKEVVYAPEEVIQIKVPNPVNAFRGRSAVEAAADIIDIDTFAEQTLKNMFANGALMNFALSTDQRLTQDNVERLRQDFRSRFTGWKKAFNIPVFSGGLKPTPIQFNNRELQFLEIQKWTRDKIMALFDNTKVSLGITEDVNRANAEASLLAWKQNIIKPKMQRITDTLNEFLAPRFGQNLILGFEDPVPENQSAKIEEIKGLITNVSRPVITVNEARDMLDLPPVDDEQFDTIERNVIPTLQTPETPKAILNVNHKRVLRQRGLLDKQNLLGIVHQAAVEFIKAQRKGKKSAPKVKDISKHFSNEEIWSYWAKQIKLVEIVEKRFQNKILQFLRQLEEKVVGELRQHKSLKQYKKKAEPFDFDTEVGGAIDLFEPLLQEIMQLSAEQSFNLLSQDRSYVPSVKVKEQNRNQVELFANSFLNTDKELLAELIAEGIKNGNSVPEIERSIRSEFTKLSKTQTERITRSEIIRASNYGAEDAFKQSGVVEAKQWLTAGDPCPYCEPLNGKIVELDVNYFDKGDQWLGNADRALDLSYSDVEDPPLHVNCRCVIIPVLKDIRELKVSDLQSQIASLREKIKQDSEYTRELEKTLELADGPGTEA